MKAKHRVTLSSAGCQALLALVLQQGLPDQPLSLVAAEDFAVLRSFPVLVARLPG